MIPPSEPLYIYRWRKDGTDPSTADIGILRKAYRKKGMRLERDRVGFWVEPLVAVAKAGSR